MSIYKPLEAKDIKTSRSFLNQIVDVLSNDISSSASRQKYQHYASGTGAGPGVTSSIYQTVFDQDFTTSSANAFMDMTVGLFYTGSIVNAVKSGTDTAGKPLFLSSSLMMREKIDMYRMMASSLLGDPDGQFQAPFDSTSLSDKMDPVLFLSFKRLFARDKIKPETFSTRFLKLANDASGSNFPGNLNTVVSGTALSTGNKLYTDAGSSTNRFTTVAGEVGSIVDASDTTKSIGLLFYDRGVAVLDLAKVMSGSQHVSGVIHAAGTVVSGTFGLVPGYMAIGQLGTTGGTTGSPSPQSFIPDFMVSGSMDDIIDHIGSVRFHSGSTSALTFSNVTTINSTLVYCRVDPDDANYSSNPTFRDANDRIVVVDPGQELTQQTFTFITSVGLYDASDNLLAVAKLSRPVEKNPEKEFTIRLRIDF